MSDPSYRPGDEDSPVAICTLSSADLLQAISESPIVDRVAMIGPLETENIGIERMATTLLRHPRIRWLIVCGDERRGPYQAQALHSLFADGIESDGAIAGARSRRARLPTLTPAHIDALRRQVTVREMIGEHDLDAISRAVEECRARDPGAFDQEVVLPGAEPIVVPSRPFRLKEHDPNGFFVILVDASNNRLLVEHYQNDGKLGHSIVGPDAESLCGALIEWGLLSRLDHAAYLGRELSKAELALRHSLSYRQDEPV